MNERIKQLPGSVNLRDIGGYQLADGRGSVRWGKVLRSGSLSSLTDTAINQLAELGVQIVFDLRSAEEIEASPSRIPPNVDYRHRPIVDPARFSTLRAAWTLIFKRSQLSKSMLEGYTRVMIDGNAHIIGDMLTAIAQQPEGAVLVHCTAGKDRTGLFIALLLHLLGVSPETIVADYAVSNQFYDQFAKRLQTDLAILRRLRLTDAQIKPLLIADPQLLRQSLTHIEQTYGSIEQYVLTRAGVTPNTLVLLRQKLID